jgi:NADH-quinone oxidoreductase subunit A
LSPFLLRLACDIIHKVQPAENLSERDRVEIVLPILLFVVVAAAVSCAMIAAPRLLAPRKRTLVKEMPYESGMDPVHDARRRFAVRFHLVAIAFLVFDVELLFLYPWAVATQHTASGEPPRGIDMAVAQNWISSRGLVFGGAMLFILLVVLGFVYDWRKGIFKWR